MIYGMHNLYGQLRPFVFLSDKEGKLRYRPDLSIYNLSYDTISKSIRSFYEGGVYSNFSKDIYKWENDSLKLVRGASMQYASEEEGYVVEFYEKDATKPYQTVKKSSEQLWDTAVFKIYPDVVDTADIK